MTSTARGWQRTYPHLMTMEAIKGLEFITFDQKNADEEPTHAAMLPFTVPATSSLMATAATFRFDRNWCN